MFGFLTTAASTAVTANAQTADKTAPKWDPSKHVAPASYYEGLPRVSAGVEVKGSPSDAATFAKSDPNAVLNLDNHRIGDAGPTAATSPTAKSAIIAPPVLAPLTIYDLKARLQVAQATYAGAQLGYKQALREGDNARVATEQAQMTTSMSNIKQLNNQIKTFSVQQQTTATAHRKTKRAKLKK